MVSLTLLTLVLSGPYVARAAEEDKIDIAEAEKAIRRNKFTSWNQAKKKLGL